MKCIVTYFPCLARELGEAGYAMIIKQLQEKIAKERVFLNELITGSEDAALEIIKDEVVCYERELLILTDSSVVAWYCMDRRIPYGVVLCKENQGDAFPQGAYCMESLEDIEYDYLECVYRRGSGLPWIITETARLMIREITKADVPRLYELYADEDITKYMEPLFSTIQEEEEYTEKYIQNVYHFYGYGIWLLVEKQSGTVIGRAGLEYHDDFEGLELGFMLGKQYWHQGYAYEACEAILAYGKVELEQYSYRALVHIDNEASKRLCEKLGFEAFDTVDLNGVSHVDYRKIEK